tara:strand:+ start:958 stop:1140 length:183 start_codon:yes stop_codon:yes gene_type:complete
MWKYILRLWRGKHDDGCISEQSLTAIRMADARNTYDGPSWTWPVSVDRNVSDEIAKARDR